MKNKDINEIVGYIYELYCNMINSQNINSIINKDQIIYQIFNGPKICMGNISFEVNDDSFIVEILGDFYKKDAPPHSTIYVYSLDEKRQIYRSFKNKVLRKK